MAFEYNVVTSAGAALIAQATSSNPIVIVSALSSASAAESLADLASKTTAFYDGKAGTIFAASATNNVARIIMNFNNNSVQTPQVIKSACILARLQNQTDSQAVIMAACSDDSSQITIPIDSAPLVHIHIPINITINTNDQVATVGAEYAAVADLERFVSWHKAGDSSEGDAQTILGDKTFSNHAVFNGLATFNNTVNIVDSHLNADIISANGIECSMYYLTQNESTDDTISISGWFDEDNGCYARIGAYSNEGDPDQSNLWNNCLEIKSAGKPDGTSQFSNNYIKLSSRGETNNENCYIMASNGDGEPSVELYTQYDKTTQSIDLTIDDIQFCVKNTDISSNTYRVLVTTSNSVPEFSPAQNATWFLGNSSRRWLYGYINSVVANSIETSILNVQSTLNVQSLAVQSTINTQSINAAMINGQPSFLHGVSLLRSAQQIGRETGLVFWKNTGNTNTTENVDFRNICQNILSGMPNGIDDTARPIGMIGLYIYTGSASATIRAGEVVSGDDLRSVALKISNGEISFVQPGDVGLGGHYTILCNIPVLESGETALVLAVRSSNT